MRILVTGAGGQLGRDVALHCADEGDDVVALDRSALDITDADAVHAAVRGARPEAIVNCAAFTAVDACETAVDLAMTINGTSVGYLASAAHEVGAHLVQVSTDYVFDGTSPRPYREDDPTNPQSVYGRSKLAGEREVGGDGTIVRTSWLCGEFGPNMVKTVLRLAGDDTPMTFVDDQRGCPTFTADLAPALRRLAADRRAGTFHLTNAGVVSWYEFVVEILVAAGHDPSRVRPIATDDLEPPRPAPRPANSELENVAWLEAGYQPLRHHTLALADLVSRLG